MSEKMGWYAVRFVYRGHLAGAAVVQAPLFPKDSDPREAAKEMRARLETMPDFPGEKGEHGTQFEMSVVPQDVYEAYGLSALPSEDKRNRVLSPQETMDYALDQLEGCLKLETLKAADLKRVEELAKLPHRYTPDGEQVVITFARDITTEEALAVSRYWSGPTGQRKLGQFRAAVG